jgi:hypothetical protein
MGDEKRTFFAFDFARFSILLLCFSVYAKMENIKQRQQQQ